MSERTGLASKTAEKKAKNPVAAKSKTDFSQSIDSPVKEILHLQRTIGNQAVHKLLKSGTIQAKFKIGKPNDKYEQEADRVADKVMSMPEQEGSLVNGHWSLAQRKSGCPECPEKEGIQTKPLAVQITPLVQRQADEEEEPVQGKLLQRQGTEEEEEPIQTKQAHNHTPAVNSNIESSINSLKGGGQPLPESTRSYFEPRFGADFSQVRVYTNSKASETAKSVNAKAFTSGKDVVFGAGQYSPETSSGKRLMAHELTHVLQQGPSRIYRQVKKFKPKIHWGGIGYRRLLADKKLEIGVAIGYPALYQYHKLVKYLEKNKFRRMESPFLKNLGSFVETLPIQIKYLKKGVERWEKIKRFWIKGTKGRRKKPINVNVIIDIVNQETRDPKKHYAEFLSSKEIAIYSGHARYGTGSDFDSEKSVKENFIIGVNSALHKTGKLTKGDNPKVNKALKGKANDLEKMSKTGRFNKKKYQIWFFNACKTIHYLDEIRGGLVKGKNRTNLRVVGTTGKTRIDPIPFIDGILKKQSMSQILKRLNKAESARRKEKTVRSRYFSD